MRIGILTLPLHTNYGGILQAYALQMVLERMGHEVVVIDKQYIFKISFLKKCFAYPKRAICKYILGDKRAIIRWEKVVGYQNNIVRRYTQTFINNYIRCYNVNDINLLNKEDFDAIVVGSDQIWRPIYYPTIEHAYLDFASSWNIKRIAYAPSFGVDTWEYSEEQTKNCKALVKKFDAVSVREQSGVALCEKYFDVDAEWVLDPTMLLNAEDYIELFRASDTPQSEGNLLDYILDREDDKETMIRQVASKANLKPFRMNSRVEDPTAPLEERVQPPVEKWLRGFYDAKLVVTDSFHACVFSILFKKPFVVVANRERGLSRIESLLGYFGLTDRIVCNASDAMNLSDIDYGAVYKKLEMMRVKSKGFLQKYL